MRLGGWSAAVGRRPSAGRHPDRRGINRAGNLDRHGSDAVGLGTRSWHADGPPGGPGRIVLCAAVNRLRIELRPSLPLGLAIRLRGTGVQNSDGSGTITLVEEGTQNLQITLNVSAEVAAQWTQSYAGHLHRLFNSATFNGQAVAAVCGATQVNLELGSSDDGGIRGTLTTAAVTS